MAKGGRLEKGFLSGILLGDFLGRFSKQQASCLALGCRRRSFDAKMEGRATE
jgi:hypothetical protein